MIAMAHGRVWFRRSAAVTTSCDPELPRTAWIVIRLDGGREFLTRAVTRAAGELGCVALPAAPYAPSASLSLISGP
jgi:hypothetical protein